MALRDTDNLGPESSGQTSEGVWPYVGVGCLTAISGMMGSAMIAVLLAKISGMPLAARRTAKRGLPVIG